MSIEVTDLDSLDTNEVLESLTRSRSLISEQYPERQVRGGAFEDVVLRADAMLATVHRTNFDRLRNSQSLKAIEDDPTLVDDDVLDAVASNYRITRLEGASATGDITVVVSTAVDTIIAAGAQFTAPNSQVFETTDLFTGRASSADVLTDNDRVMTELNDGTFAFTISATAVDVGTTGNISIFTELTPTTPPANFLRSYASSSFTGGIDDEDSAALMSRLQTGVAHRSLCSRAAIEGVIRADEDYEDIVGISVIGYGDSEQIRYHTIFPVAFGGRVDAYVRSAAIPVVIELTKTATLVHSNGTWQFSITRDEAPGFYEVKKILLPDDPTDDEGFDVTLDTRGMDITVATASEATPGTAFIPDLEATKEAAYSRYQTAVIRFLDDVTPTGGLTVGVDTQEYRVFLKVMPGIDEIQDLVSAREVRSPAGDCLVKAPVPCFVTVAVTINKRDTDPDIDEGLVQQAIIDAVNATGFTGKLSASRLATAAEAALDAQGLADSAVAEIELTGRILKPDGTTSNISSSTLLDVGSSPSDMVTGRTVAFISELDDVDITVVDVTLPEV